MLTKQRFARYITSIETIIFNVTIIVISELNDYVNILKRLAHDYLGSYCIRKLSTKIRAWT